jgi:hypothetical protein
MYLRGNSIGTDNGQQTTDNGRRTTDDTLTLASRGLEEPAHTSRGLEELYFQLCCRVSFWFWWEIGFEFTYLHTLLNNFFGTNIFLIVVKY